VNFLVTFMMLIGGLSSLQASQVIPLLAGLASLPLYAVCRRLDLTKGASALSALFLTFNPIYSYVTFTGAVMKETATYYLTMLVLFAATLALKHRGSKASIALCTLVCVGIVLGHHFAGLVVFLFLWAVTSYVLMDRLWGGGLQFVSIFVLTLGFSVIFILWNLMNYLAIGSFHPVFNVTDLSLLIACFVLVWVSIYKDRGVFSGRIPWFVLAAIPIAVLGQTGRIYSLVKPDFLNLLETRGLLALAVLGLVGLTIFSVAGLAKGLTKRYLKAYTTAAVTMVLFAFLWGHSLLGFTLLIKSLHYFGPLLALGAGFTTAALLAKGTYGKLVIVTALVSIILASLTGTYMALNGLGAYSRGELEAARDLPSISTQVTVYGDTHASYLFSYICGLTISQVKPLKNLGSNALIILFKPNWEQGFLYGYDWIVKDAIAPDEQLLKRGRVYDSAYLQAWV
jgi:hypothetical protein